MKNKFSGRVWILGDNIDTDIIIPTQYMTLPSVQEMCRYAFSPIRPELAGQIQQGDILVAGNNFGCGSSREQAPEIIKALGVQAVIAKSFARIFYRNAFNNGLLVIENNTIQESCMEHDILAVDLSAGTLILNNTDRFTFPGVPEMLLTMIDAGGLVPYYREKNKGNQDETDVI